MCPSRVLVVDDNVDMRESLVAILELLGHRAVAADSGTHALDILKTAERDGESFDLAIVDVGLPDMSGYELVTVMRQQGVGASARIVALTGWASASDKDRAIQAGFDAHLAKPVELQELTELLQRMESGPGD